MIRLTSNLRGEGGRRLSVGRCGADTQGDGRRDEYGGDEETAMPDEIAYLKEKSDQHGLKLKGYRTTSHLVLR